MSRGSITILATLAVVTFGSVSYALEHQARAPVHAHSSLQTSKKTTGDERTIASAAVRSNAKPVAQLGYSEKEYTFLRQRYKSLNPQAYGTLSASRLNQLEWLMTHGVVAERRFLPVAEEVIQGKVSALENKLNAGLSPDTTVFIGYPYDSNVSLLDIAIKAGQRGIIKTLLMHGASVNPPDEVTPNGMPYRFEGPLVVAAEYGEDDVVRDLLQRGANVNQRHGLQSDNNSALAQAVYSGNVATVYLLLIHGADVNSVLGPGGAMPHMLDQRSWYPRGIEYPRRVALRKLLIKYGAKMPQGQ